MLTITPLAPIGDRSVVQDAIADAATASGIDFSYLLRQARIESGLNPAARAGTSSATGLYQFIEQSWLSVVSRHGRDHDLGWAADAITRGEGGHYRIADPAMRRAILDLRRDPAASSAMAAELASDNRAFLENRLGRMAQSADLYLAHFLGPGAAVSFLRHLDADPSQPAAGLFPAAARSNRAVFLKRDGTPRSLAEVHGRIAQQFASAYTPPDFWRAPAVVRAPATVPVPPTTNARLAYLMLASLAVA